MAKSRPDGDHIEVSIVGPLSQQSSKSKLLPPLSLQYHSELLSPVTLEQNGRRLRLDHSGWVNGSVYSGNRHSSYDTCLLSPRDDLSGSMPILYSSSVSCWELRDLTPAPTETSTTHPPDGVNDQSVQPLTKAHAASLAIAARNSARNNNKPLSKKAKWLIIVIGIILFGMSMLLVGITLRLAPMIDEMVRQETQHFMQQQTQPTTLSSNLTTSSPGDLLSTVNTTVT